MSECIIQLANINKNDVAKLKKAISEILPDAIVTKVSVGHAIVPQGCLVAELSRNKKRPGIEIDIIDNNAVADVVAIVQQPLNGCLTTLAYMANKSSPMPTRYNITRVKKRTLDVFIKDADDTIGYATIDISDTFDYRASMYQGRIDTMLLYAEEPSDWVVFNSVANSKMFTSEVPTELDALNSILEFWSIDLLAAMPEIQEAPTMVDAINYFRSVPDKYMVCHLYNGADDKEVDIDE